MIRDLLVAGLGVALVALGLLLTVGSPAPDGVSTIAPVVASVVALGAVVLAGWKVRGALDGTTNGAVPWADDQPFASPTPEHSATEHPLSGVALARILEAAGETARNEGTVEDGLDVVRPALRDTLHAALVAGGASPEAAANAISNGTWTDDAVAASVLDEAVEPPDASLRERVEAWLLPERVLRRRTRIAVDALAERADRALPPVPGQTAPRTVPVVRPTLETLQRGADGRLQRAIDPMAVARGPLPPAPASDDTAEDEP